MKTLYLKNKWANIFSVIHKNLMASGDDHIENTMFYFLEEANFNIVNFTKKNIYAIME